MKGRALRPCTTASLCISTTVWWSAMVGISSRTSVGRWKVLASQLPGKVLRSAVDRTVRVDFSRTADADEGREPEPFLLGARDQLAQHGAQAVHRFLARHLVFVGVAPQLETPNFGFCQLRRLLEIELDHAGSDVGSADIDGQNGVVALEQP